MKTQKGGCHWSAPDEQVIGIGWRLKRHFEGIALGRDWEIGSRERSKCRCSCSRSGEQSLRHGGACGGGAPLQAGTIADIPTLTSRLIRVEDGELSGRA